MLLIIIILLSWYIISLIIWNDILSKTIDYLTKIFFIIWLISTIDLIKELKEWNKKYKILLKQWKNIYYNSKMIM